MMGSEMGVEWRGASDETSAAQRSAAQSTQADARAATLPDNPKRLRDHEGQTTAMRTSLRRIKEF